MGDEDFINTVVHYQVPGTRYQVPTPTTAGVLVPGLAFRESKRTSETAITDSHAQH